MKTRKGERVDPIAMTLVELVHKSHVCVQTLG